MGIGGYAGGLGAVSPQKTARKREATAFVEGGRSQLVYFHRCCAVNEENFSARGCSCLMVGVKPRSV